MTYVTLSPRETRLRAAELIEERGWCQGDWCDGDGHLCVNAALIVAADPTFELPIRRPLNWPRAAAEAHGELAETIGDYDTTTWNDEPDRTEAEVIAALRAEVAR